MLAPRLGLILHIEFFPLGFYIFPDYVIGYISRTYYKKSPSSKCPPQYFFLKYGNSMRTFRGSFPLTYCMSLPADTCGGTYRNRWTWPREICSFKIRASLARHIYRTNSRILNATSPVKIGFWFFVIRTKRNLMSYWETWSDKMACRYCI